MAECSAEEYLELSKCFDCGTPKQLSQIRCVLLCRILQAIDPMATCDPVELLGAAKCYDCLDTHQLQMVQAQLLCEILTHGGSGSSCLLCGVADPVAAPSCDCALYYNRTTGSFWYWDTGLSTWIEMIGP